MQGEWSLQDHNLTMSELTSYAENFDLKNGVT
jgi:hypothetical protein